jgi:hypothetical protein
VDTEVLVEDRIDDGQKLLAELVRAGFDVTVAVWVRTGEEGLWFLYIGSASVDPAKIGDAYRALYACLSRVSAPGLSFSEIKLVNASNPVASNALAIRDRHPSLAPIRYDGERLGDMAIEEAYIYPPLQAPGPRPGGEQRRLKKEVQQVDRPEDQLLTRAEQAAVSQIVSSGVNVQQAEEWVRKWRQKRHPRPPIPAGTLVRAWVVARWGDAVGDDTNPLLMVEAPDGARGLVFMEDTEPV